MNLCKAVYLFGVFKSGYSSWPNDATSAVLKELYKNAKAETQVVVHRKDNLMHYCYIRKLDSGRYIGFCIVCANRMLVNIDSLFPLFEGTIERMLEEGSIIYYTKEGKLATNVEQLYAHSEAVSLVLHRLTEYFEQESRCAVLPPWDFAVAQDSLKTFSVEDEKGAIVHATQAFSYTYIYKDKDYNTVQMNRHKAVLSRLDKENTSLKEQNAKLKRQKKQFTIVIVLFLIVILCGLGISSLRKDLDTTTSELNDVSDKLNSARSEVYHMDSVLGVRNRTITYMKSSISSLQDSVICKNSTISSLQDSVICKNSTILSLEDNVKRKELTLKSASALQPFIIKNTRFNFNTGEYTFDYYCYVSGYYDITFRVFHPESNGHYTDYKKSVWLRENEGGASVGLSNQLNRSKYYFISIMYKDKVVGGSLH